MENKELNCHVEILDGGLRFSYSGDAEVQFQKGTNVAADQLWNKLYLIFSERKWQKKYKVKDVKDFFSKYTYKDIFEGIKDI